MAKRLTTNLGKAGFVSTWFEDTDHLGGEVTAAGA